MAEKLNTILTRYLALFVSACTLLGFVNTLFVQPAVTKAVVLYRVEKLEKAHEQIASDLVATRNIRIALAKRVDEIEMTNYISHLEMSHCSEYLTNQMGLLTKAVKELSDKH